MQARDMSEVEEFNVFGEENSQTPPLATEVSVSLVASTDEEAGFST